MGTIKTTNIQTITGSGTLTLGTSGETITIPSGVTVNRNAPSFLAQGINSDTNYTANTILPYPQVIYDTGSNYNSSTGRFTAPLAGVYLAGHSIWQANSLSGTARARFLVNGSAYKESSASNGPSSRIKSASEQYSAVTFPINLAVNDYVEVQVFEASCTLFWANYFFMHYLG